MIEGQFSENCGREGRSFLMDISDVSVVCVLRHCTDF